MDIERRTTDPRVAALLTAAAAPAELPLPGETAALAAFRAASRRRKPRSMRSVLVASALFGGLVTAGGAAAAATGTLPLVTSHSHATTHQQPAAPVDDAVPGLRPDPRPGPGHPGSAATGSSISQLATTTDATGVDKGAAICTAASKDKCQAGQHSDAPSHDATGMAQRESHAPPPPTHVTPPALRPMSLR